MTSGSSEQASGRKRHDIDFAVFLPFVVHALLMQIVTVLTRVTTSYRAIELDLSVIWYGAINSGYALLPIFLAVHTGRFIDRGNDARTVWGGSTLILLAAVGFWTLPQSPWLLLAYTVVGGVGHLFIMAGHQALTLRCSGPVSREGIFGYYMVVLSIGQMIAPLVIGWMAAGAKLPPTQPLFTIAFAGAGLAFLLGFALRSSADAVRAARESVPVPLMDLIRTRGLMVVIVASVMTVTAFDLMAIYLPLLGAERDIGAAQIGWMLTVRALASIAARLGYPVLLRMLGRSTLTLLTMLLAASGFVFLGFSENLWLMYIAVALTGMGLGVAVTLCLSNVVELSPANARGTAMSLRLTGNRIGQFVIPFLSSLIATVTGVAGIFFIIAVLLAGSGGTVKAILKR